MNLPLISVIVPVYNTSQYLENTVNLLIEQTYQNLEIILVDDGSTDDSPQICDRLAEQDIRIRVIHQANAGVCAARNAGVAAAKGAYIGFCDSDDIPHKDLYETLYTLAVENDCDFVTVSSAIHFINGKIKDTSTGELNVYENKEDFLKLFLLNKLHTSVYTKLFSKELCSKISFPSPRKINEDKYYTFLAIINCKKICYKNVCKYNYCRRQGSSGIQGFSDKFFDITFFANEIDKEIKEKYPKLSDFSKVNIIISYLRLSQLIFLLNGEKKYSNKLGEIFAYLKSLDNSFCKKYLTKNIYIKWRLAKLGYLPYKISVKLFSKL